MPFGLSRSRHRTAMIATVNSHGRMYTTRNSALVIVPRSWVLSIIAKPRPSSRWATTLTVVKKKVFPTAV
jgi:hypothetical protein